MNNMFEFFKKLFGVKSSGFVPEEQDERDFTLLGGDEIMGISSYTPKHQNHIIKTLEIKDQAGQNTCVCESLATQKEIDEGLVLDPQDMAIHLRSEGNMSSKGTSLSAAQKALASRGNAKRGFLPNKYNTWWDNFSNPKLMTEEIKQDAATHKSKSYYRTFSIDKVIEELDNDRIGHTGCTWYRGYGDNFPYIIDAFKGTKIYGHAFSIIGYKMSHYNEKVLVCQNSFGKKWGDSGKFYIKFSDFARVLQWGVYFNSDLDKDKIGWLSIHQKQAVKELNGPKIFIIEGEKKRHVPNMPMLHMVGKLTTFIEDKDNMLPDINSGKVISISDITPDRIKEVKEQIRLLKDANFLSEEYGEYFPDLFE